MSRRETGEEFLARTAEAYDGVDLLKADGWDDCIVGVGERCAHPPVLVYDVERMVAQMAREIRRERSRTSECWQHPEEIAREYIEFNVLGAWVGEQTPLFLTMRRKERG